MMKNKTLSPTLWFVVLWFCGLGSCLLLAQSVRLLLPKNEKPTYKMESVTRLTKKDL